LETFVACDIPHLVADERRLKQILLNLLSNAIKFTAPQGLVALTVSCRSGEGHVFEVKDTGQGMTEDEIAKSMTKFGQVARAANKDMEGTGLGLPLTQGLVHLHGGHFQIESEKGQGTTVTVSFPEQRSRVERAS
jgi:signal transduction histidine kinase